MVYVAYIYAWACVYNVHTCPRVCTFFFLSLLATIFFISRRKERKDYIFMHFPHCELLRGAQEYLRKCPRHETAISCFHIKCPIKSSSLGFMASERSKLVRYSSNDTKCRFRSVRTTRQIVSRGFTTPPLRCIIPVLGIKPINNS